VAEEVTEIKVQLQCAKNRLTDIVFFNNVLAVGSANPLNPHGAVAGQSGSDYNAARISEELHRRATRQGGESAGDDQTNDAHEQEMSPAAQVFLRRYGPEAHGREGAGGNEEDLGNACLSVDEKNDRQSQAVQG